MVLQQHALHYNLTYACQGIDIRIRVKAVTFIVADIASIRTAFPTLYILPVYAIILILQNNIILFLKLIFSHNPKDII